MAKPTDVAEPQLLHNSPAMAGYVVVGSIAVIDSNGKPLVEFSGNPNPDPIVALSTVSVSQQHVDRQVALAFNQGDMRQPVIVGLIHNPLEEVLQNFELTPVKDQQDEAVEEPSSASTLAELPRGDDETVLVDGKQVIIEGSEEVTFKCGKASITLTQTGKIIIRGTYLLNRSSGVNRIMGGSVQIN